MEQDQHHTMELWPTDLSGAKYGLTVSTVSALLFYVSSLLTRVVTPTNIITEKQKWRWKNISVSIIHALIGGIWSILCFVEEPKMLEDLIETHTTSGHTLLSVSAGYFLYDTLDMLVCQRTRQTLELFFHHIVIICCFGLAIVTKMGIGYGVMALIVELNSIFLHSRQLLQCYGVPKTSSIYKLNSLINLGTFIAFRIVTISWMTIWIIINKDLIPLVFYCIGTISLAIVMVMNTVLFCRLVYSDFLRKKQSVRKDQ